MTLSLPTLRRRNPLHLLLDALWRLRNPGGFRCTEFVNGDVVAVTVKRIDWDDPRARWNSPPVVSVAIDVSDLDRPRRLRTDLEGRVVEIGGRRSA